jgi:hypothetical protein
MQDEIVKVIENLTSIIERELPEDRSQMLQFISDLDMRFPKCQRSIRAIFEKVYLQKFKEKFVW